MENQPVINNDVIELLKQLASKECWLDVDDFNADDYSGGNFDDAFSGGVDAGRVDLARDLLNMMGIEFEIPVEDR